MAAADWSSTFCASVKTPCAVLNDKTPKYTALPLEHTSLYVSGVDKKLTVAEQCVEVRFELNHTDAGAVIVVALAATATHACAPFNHKPARPVTFDEEPPQPVENVRTLPAAAVHVMTDGRALPAVDEFVTIATV